MDKLDDHPDFLGEFVPDNAEYAAEIARLRAENDALKNQWQPMATAPADGTQILVYEEHGGINVMLFMEGRFREKVSFCSLRSPPTHWMPLPQQPNA